MRYEPKYDLKQMHFDLTEVFNFIRHYYYEDDLSDEASFTKEFIKVGEFGLALEHMYSYLVEHRRHVPVSVYRLFRTCGELMGYDAIEWDRLLDHVNEDKGKHL